jgi:hypothetical protein
MFSHRAAGARLNLLARLLRKEILGMSHSIGTRSPSASRAAGEDLERLANRLREIVVGAGNGRCRLHGLLATGLMLMQLAISPGGDLTRGRVARFEELADRLLSVLEAYQASAEDALFVLGMLVQSAAQTAEPPPSAGVCPPEDLQ